MNTLSMWSCKIKVDEVHSTALIYQNLEIPSFGGPAVWPVIFHQHTDITTYRLLRCNTSLPTKMKFYRRDEKCFTSLKNEINWCDKLQITFSLLHFPMLPSFLWYIFWFDCKVAYEVLSKQKCKDMGLRGFYQVCLLGIL